MVIDIGDQVEYRIPTSFVVECRFYQNTSYHIKLYIKYIKRFALRIKLLSFSIIKGYNAQLELVAKYITVCRIYKTC